MRAGILIAILGASSLISSAQAQQINTNGFTALWQFTDATKSQLQFTVTSTVQNQFDWTSIAFSPAGSKSHQNSDMIVGYVSSAGPQVLDTNSNSKSRPAVDTVQNLKNVAASFQNGVVTMSFTRALDTGDAAQDLALKAGAGVTVGWAYGPNANGGANYAIHTKRGDLFNQDVVGKAKLAAGTQAADGQDALIGGAVGGAVVAVGLISAAFYIKKKRNAASLKTGLLNDSENNYTNQVAL